MIKHTHTETTEVNFSKLSRRIMAINDPILGRVNSIRKMVNELICVNTPTLIVATGGSKAVAYYLQFVLERLGLSGITCEVIEPRDYFYKSNTDSFSNLVVVSASGNTNGIKDILASFKGKKYLVCEKDKMENFEVISWGNELYESEHSFISLATSLCPITLLLDVTASLDLQINANEIRKINDKIKSLLEKSEGKAERLCINFKDTHLIQIISGYETRTSSSILESNLTETGICIPVIHDIGSYSHGRSNLLFRYPKSHVIYLSHKLKEIDNLIIDLINNEYHNLSLFTTSDLDDNIFWKEFYLILQMYFLSKKIADDKGMDLTMPEYNPRLIKKLYSFKGEM